MPNRTPADELARVHLAWSTPLGHSPGWTGRGKRYGYLRLWDGEPGARRPVYVAVHRYAWELAHGPILAGMHVLHSCDTPRCFWVEHLFLGTNADNVADMVAKGRQQHKLTPEIVAEIRARWVPGNVGGLGAGRVHGPTLRELADEYGVNDTTVLAIVKRKSWKHVH